MWQSQTKFVSQRDGIHRIVFFLSLYTHPAICLNFAMKQLRIALYYEQRSLSPQKSKKQIWILVGTNPGKE